MPVYSRDSMPPKNGAFHLADRQRAYGPSFLSNLWYPDRLNTVRLGFIQGTPGLGFDLMGNIGAKVRPDIKRPSASG